MAQVHLKEVTVADADVRLQRGRFIKTMFSELSGWLPDALELDNAADFIGVVGQNIGYVINDSYKQALKVTRLNRTQLCQILENIMPRIQRDFYLIQVNSNKMVFGNRIAPFGDNVKDHPSLCMLISNILGTIGAENFGYTKVELLEASTSGDASCRVIVYLGHNDEARVAGGREYYKVGHK